MKYETNETEAREIRRLRHVVKNVQDENNRLISALANLHRLVINEEDLAFSPANVFAREVLDNIAPDWNGGGQ